MIVLPVIERELRSQARHGFTYMLRLLGATALIFVCAWFGGKHGFSSKFGAYLFGCLNCTLVVSIWIFVPLICADCISRERREGTVGLLFLTPLKPGEVVLAKGLVHGVRAITLWLAVLPVMTLTFLIGGVSWKEAVLSILVNFSSICWALAAGLLASSYSKRWLRAILLAGGLAVALAVVFDLLNGCLLLKAIGSDANFRLPIPYSSWDWQDLVEHNFSQLSLPTGFFGITGLGGWWGTLFGSLKLNSQRAWLMSGGVMALISMLVLLQAVLIAARNLQRKWQEEPPSARQLWIQEKFCTPVVGVNFFRHWLKRKLERNPIGWLEQRTWTGRTVTWGWLAVMISFYSVVFSAANVDSLLGFVQSLMAWLMIGIIAASAAGSFQRERETGVLEILLVSPMSVGQIISGRLRGLWGQFLPALALLLGVWTYFAGVFIQHDDTERIPFFFTAFATVPVIGLYYSLQRKHFIAAFLSTLWTSVVLPFVLCWVLVLAADLLLGFGANYFGRLSGSTADSWLLMWLFGSLYRTTSSSVFVIIIQVAIAIRMGRRLYQDLSSRNFSFSKAGG